VLKPLAAALVVIALSACSSSSSSASSPSPSPTPTVVSASAYAASVCTAITTYQTNVTQQAANFNSNTTDLAVLKQGFLDVLNGILQSTQTLITDVNAAGIPDTPKGQQDVDEFNTELLALQTSIQDLRDQVQNLSTNDPVAFSSAIRPIIQKFQTDIQEFGQTFQKPDDPQLTAAFSQAPECAKLVSATPSASPTS
jgi:hypothetical protein